MTGLSAAEGAPRHWTHKSTATRYDLERGVCFYAPYREGSPSTPLRSYSKPATDVYDSGPCWIGWIGCSQTGSLCTWTVSAEQYYDTLLIDVERSDQVRSYG